MSIRSSVILVCTAVTLTFSAVTTVSANESALTIYPAKGQTSEQLKQDQGILPTVGHGTDWL